MSLLKAFKPVYILTLLFGCHLIYYQQVRLKWSLYYSVFCISNYYGATYYVLGHINKCVDFFIIIQILAFFTIIANILSIYRNSFNNFWHLIKLLNELDRSLKSIGCDINYCQLSLHLYFRVGFWLLNVVLLIVIFNFNNIHLFFHSSFLIVIAAHLPLLGNSICNLSFITVVRVIGERLGIINHMLKKFQITRITNIQRRNIINNRNNRISENRRINVLPQPIETQFQSSNNYSKVLMLRQLHLELAAIGEYVSNHYGIRLTLPIITYNFIIIISLAKIINHIMLLKIPTLDHWINLLILWSIYEIVWLYLTCADTVSQYKQTNTIIHKFGILKKDDKFENELQQFSYQITERIFQFQPFGLPQINLQSLRIYFGAIIFNSISLAWKTSKIREFQKQ